MQNTPPPLPELARRLPRRAPAPFLPMSRKEMDALGWDACDIILEIGRAHV